MNKLIQFFTSLSMVLMLSLGLATATMLLPANGSALTNKEAACMAIDGTTDCSGNKGGTDINSIIKTGINIFTSIVGIIAIIMIIVAGFKYITSAGDSAKITSAKNTLVYALVGLVIVALSQFIVKFVLNRTTRTSPTCTSTQVLDDKTNKCVAKPAKK